MYSFILYYLLHQNRL